MTSCEIVCGISVLEKYDYLIVHGRFTPLKREVAVFSNTFLFFMRNIRHYLPENTTVIKLFVSKISKSQPPLVGSLAVQICVVSEDAR